MLAGDGREQPDLALAEGVLALVVLEHDRAENAWSPPTIGTRIELSGVSVPGTILMPSALASATVLTRPIARVAQDSSRAARQALRGLAGIS